MSTEQIKHFIVHDRHKGETKSGDFAVVNEVYCVIDEPDGGEPSGYAVYENNVLTIHLKNLKGDTGNAISGVDIVPSAEDGGQNVVTLHFSESEDVTFVIRNGSKGPKGDTGPKGETGDTVVYGGSDLLLADMLGNETVKGMTQRAITAAIMDNIIMEWDPETVTNDSNVKITVDGSTATVESATGYYHIYHAPVTDGDMVKVTLSKQSSSVMGVVIAIFDDAPAEGDTAREILLNEEVTAGTHEYRYPVTASGYVALGTYGQSTEVGISVGQAAKDQIDGIRADIDGADVTPLYSVVEGKFITWKGEEKGSSSFAHTGSIFVKTGDILTFTCDGGSGGANSVLNYTNQAGDQWQSVWGNQKGVATREFIATAGCYMCVSYAMAGGLSLSVIRGGIANDIKTLKNSAKSIVLYGTNDGMRAEEKPLEHLMFGPSRVRVFKSYGVIGGSFETGYTNTSSGDTPYDVGYEWPTLMGLWNGIKCYNYALPGHTFKTWLADRNKTSYSKGFPPLWKNDEHPWASHHLPWDSYTEQPECFIVNLSSNDASASYAIGNPNDIDFANDYTNDDTYSDRNFCESFAAILQLIRIRAPRCYIFAANMRGGRDETQRVNSLNQALSTIVNKFHAASGHCYLLDITGNGMNWKEFGPGAYVSGEDGSHPTRLGHVYLACQFNTMIDWYIGKHPEEFLDAAYVSPFQVHNSTPPEWTEQIYNR